MPSSTESSGTLRGRHISLVVAAAIAVVAGCGSSGVRTTQSKSAPAAAPLAVCSLLTAREVSAVFRLPVRVQPSRLSCVYVGKRGAVFRSVVVTPERVSAAPPARFDPSGGTIVDIAGPGYRGQAQNDAPSTSAAGLAQAHSQVLSGQLIVRLFVTYHGGGLRAIPQLREVTALSDRAGKSLARSLSGGAASG